MSSESIAHSAFGLMSYWLRAHSPLNSLRARSSIGGVAWIASEKRASPLASVSSRGLLRSPYKMDQPWWNLNRPARSACLFEAGRLLTFSAFRMGAYSRWVLIRGLALIRINTVFVWNRTCSAIFLNLNRFSVYVVYADITESGWAEGVGDLYSFRNRSNIFYTKCFLKIPKWLYLCAHALRTFPTIVSFLHRQSLYIYSREKKLLLVKKRERKKNWLVTTLVLKLSF